MRRSIRFCPDCGQDSFRPETDKSWRCAHCDFILYQNTAAAVAAIVVCADDILFAVRAGDPQAGKLDLPGGFVDNDETAEAALARELREELGLTGIGARYMASFPNTYPYGGIDYKTVDLIYVVELDERPSLQPADDVAGIRWVNAGSIPFAQLAFGSIRRALEIFSGKLRQTARRLTAVAGERLFPGDPPAPGVGAQGGVVVARIVGDFLAEPVRLVESLVFVIQLDFGQ